MGKVLELSFGSVADTTAGLGSQSNQSEIDLDLLPNQIAEIHHIDSQIFIEGVSPTDHIRADMALSMNPDENDDPSTAEAQSRLEFFFMHSEEVRNEQAAAGEVAFWAIRNKQMTFFNKPYLVGTNIGITTTTETDDEEARDYQYWVRIYFTRRKATAQELNQILLKRR